MRLSMTSIGTGRANSKNVAKIGFDFPDINGAYAKVEEELVEF